MYWLQRSAYTIRSGAILRYQYDDFEASHSRSALMRSLLDHPTISRLAKFMTALRYSQPAAVATHVMSATRAWLTTLSSSWRSGKFAASGLS